MRMSYNRLWKLLIDKNMKKSDLRKVAGVSSSSLAKLGKGENVTTDVILKICVALDCRVEDIMEIINDEELNSENQSIFIDGWGNWSTEPKNPWSTAAKSR